SEQLAGLQRYPDLHHPGMAGVLLDLAYRPGDVVGIDPDRAAEAFDELVVIEPAGDHHFVVGCGDRGAQVPVRHDAAGHRMQDRDVDAALAEQLLGHHSGIRTRVARLVGTLDVFAAGRLIPVHLVVGEPATAVRLLHEVLPQVLVGLHEDVDAGVDDGGLGPVAVFHHVSR